MYDDEGNWVDDGSSETTVDETNWIWNADGSITNGDTGGIFQDGQLIGYENADGSWTDLNGQSYDANNNPIGGDAAPWVVGDVDFDAAGNFVTYLGDGVFEAIDIFGTRYVGTYENGVFTPTDAGEFIPTPVIDSINAKRDQLGGGGGGGGSFGGGSQAQQAQKAAQQLANAQQQNAPAAIIAALQRQLAALQAGASSSGSGTTALWVGGALLFAFAIARRK